MPKKSENSSKFSERPPKHLGKIAASMWRKLSPFFQELDQVQAVDSNLVEMYCSVYEVYRNAYEHIKEHGEVQAIYKTVISPTGEIGDRDFTGYKRNPSTQIYSDALAKLTKIGHELGLSPEGRNKLFSFVESDDDSESAKDELKEFFATGNKDKIKKAN